MRKKKVLFATEASFHPTGYSVYTKEVLSRLSRIPELEVAELAAYCDITSPELKTIPWKVYPDIPPPSNKEAFDAYHRSSKFGEFSFDHVLLDFQPDFVMDIRDWWMLEFAERSPFRRFFNWAIMPTVDAEPQNHQWIDTYANADAVFAYSEFGRDVMIEQSDKINFIDVASPCASNVFTPVPNKALHKEKYGMDSNTIIFGTVMRNQRRKLYPDLFAAFRKFLDNNPDLTNCFLYCHTSYPDVGWNIPELLQTYNLSNKVLFTYKCKSCGKIYPSFFNDCVDFCKSCNSFSSTLVGIKNRIEEGELNEIYNLFDVYIQWANSEGWGMPQLEAAYAGLPVISINYSAMESLIANIRGIPIDPLSYYVELETGCKRAVPDNDKLVEVMTSLARDKTKLNYAANKCYNNSRKVYNWDYTAKKWADYFLKTPVKPVETTWLSPLDIKQPAPFDNRLLQVSISEQVNWLFANVLHRPDLINKALWKKTVKDLIYKMAISSHIPGYYWNDYSMPDMMKSHEEYSLEKAYNFFANVRTNYNNWEKLRGQKLGIS